MELSEDELACIDATVAHLPDKLVSMEKSIYSGNDDDKPLRYFDEDNIFTERGHFLKEVKES